MLDSQPIGMGCVFDLVRGVLASNKGGDVEKVGGIPNVHLVRFTLLLKA